MPKTGANGFYDHSQGQTWACRNNSLVRGFSSEGGAGKSSHIGAATTSLFALGLAAQPIDLTRPRAHTQIKKNECCEIDCDPVPRMLAEIYSSFSEGFDTFALKEAMALLDELNTEPAIARRKKLSNNSYSCISKDAD